MHSVRVAELHVTVDSMKTCMSLLFYYTIYCIIL